MEWTKERRLHHSKKMIEYWSKSENRQRHSDKYDKETRAYMSRAIKEGWKRRREYEKSI